MKTSVVIPVYNVEDYLCRCVESVLKLSFDIEVLLVDDGSTDRSGELCDELAAMDSRIRIIHQSNGGLSAARNTGILNSTGDYILFLDSDDFLDPAETESLHSCCNSGADVVMGLYRNYYTEQDRYEPENSPAFLKMSGLVTAEQFLNAVPGDGQTCYMTAWRFVVRREFLLNNELFFYPGIYHEDEEWTQRMLCIIDSIYVSHSWFYQYRQARAGAITSSVKPKAVWDTVLILENTLQLREKYTNVEYKWKYLSYRAAQHYLNIIVRSEVLDREGKEKIYGLLEKYRNACAPYLCGTLGTLAKRCIMLFGIKEVCGILQELRNIVRFLKNRFSS